MNSPHVKLPNGGVSSIMLRVLAALLPAIGAYCYFFGTAILVSLALASATALASEAAMLKLRGYPAKLFLTDGRFFSTENRPGDGRRRVYWLAPLRSLGGGRCNGLRVVHRSGSRRSA